MSALQVFHKIAIKRMLYFMIYIKDIPSNYFNLDDRFVDQFGVDFFFNKDMELNIT